MDKDQSDPFLSAISSEKGKAIAPESNGQVFSILLSDSDPILRELVSRTITAMGHWALPTNDEVQAKKECLVRMPDLAIVDITASGKTGIEFCRWLRSQPGGDIVPILVLTEFSAQHGKVETVQTKVDALDAGADDFLSKPFTFQELRARLGSLIRTRSMSLRLIEQHRLLEEAQACIVAQERQLCAAQIAGTAAHQLGQPITAMKLNCHLLDVLEPSDPQHTAAISAIKSDLVRLTKMLEMLKKVDAAKTENYHSGVKILEVGDKD